MSTWWWALTNGLLSPESQWNCLSKDFPMYSVLKIAWRVKITLLIIKFTRSTNYIPGLVWVEFNAPPDTVKEISRSDDHFQIKELLPITATNNSWNACDVSECGRRLWQLHAQWLTNDKLPQRNMASHGLPAIIELLVHESRKMESKIYHVPIYITISITLH